MKVEGGLSESGFSGFKDEQDDSERLFYPAPLFTHFCIIIVRGSSMYFYNFLKLYFFLLFYFLQQAVKNEYFNY